MLSERDPQQQLVDIVEGHTTPLPSGPVARAQRSMENLEEVERVRNEMVGE